MDSKLKMMKNILILCCILSLLKCVPKAEDLELRPDDFGDAQFVTFKDYWVSEIGPFAQITVKFEPFLDDLTEEQLDGLQRFVVYGGGKIITYASKNGGTFSHQVGAGGSACFRMGIVTIINNEEIISLPGENAVCVQT